MRFILMLAGLFTVLTASVLADDSAAPPAATVAAPAGWRPAPPPPPHGDQVGLQAFVLPGIGFGQNIALFRIPAHDLTFEKFVSDRADTLAKIGTVVASHPAKLCDGKFDGWYMDYKVSLGRNQAEMEQTVLAYGNAFYMATYSRGVSQSENAEGRKALDTLCIASAPVIHR